MKRRAETRALLAAVATVAGLAWLAAAMTVQGQTPAPESQECQKRALGVMMSLAMQAACESIDASYAQNKPLIAQRRANASSCIAANVPDMDEIRKQVASRQTPQTAEQLQSARKDCADHALEVAAQFRPTNAVYASPKATWKEFRNALIANDRPRALRCLAAHGIYAEIIHDMPDAELATFGKSLADIQLGQWNTEQFVEAVTETTEPDGTKHGGIVLFAKINENWLIGSL
jgi:hypothetical protein